LNALPANARGPLRVVAIGGGTGLSALLHGLKRYSKPGPVRVNITAIVTVTDDGGSSGRLRRDFDVLPPGDIRNCLVALSEDEALLSRLFQYRFKSGRGLKGHSFGNLFLTALTHITGDFPEAVRQSADVLAVAGHIYPSTASNVVIEATLADGSTVCGETRISRSNQAIREIRLTPRRARPVAAALEAIRQADLITLGPGSLFTSVIPNLLVSGISHAVRESPAIKAYFVNLMWQPGETSRFQASDHLRAIHQHARGPLIDVAVMNSGAVRKATQRRYARHQAEPVLNDPDAVRAMGVEVMLENLVMDDKVVRHDPQAVAAVALKLARLGRRRMKRRANDAN
jgi:uncharacterized cofD-like protein